MSWNKSFLYHEGSTDHQVLLRPSHSPQDCWCPQRIARDILQMIPVCLCAHLGPTMVTSQTRLPHSHSLLTSSRRPAPLGRTETWHPHPAGPKLPTRPVIHPPQTECQRWHQTFGLPHHLREQTPQSTMKDIPYVIVCMKEKKKKGKGGRWRKPIH